MKTLYTTGYSAWPTAKRLDMLVQTLQAAKITTLADVRLSPASSNLDSGSIYGPKPWTLQTEGQGIATQLAIAQIRYRWLSELGNPQKNDKDRAILREHLAANDAKWPVYRGLRLLHDMVLQEYAVCILCTCKEYEHCHRKDIAEALRDLLPRGELKIVNLPIHTGRA